jgi:hypothetical protein
LVLEVNENSPYIQSLASHECYKNVFSVNGKIHVIFSIPENIKEGLVKPFKDGRYSEIDPIIKDQLFPSRLNSKGEETMTNRLIIDKSDTYRIYWTSLIQIDPEEFPRLKYLINANKVELSEDSEVWPKPEFEEEFFNLNS